MLFNISSIFLPKLSPSKGRKQSLNLCSKQYNKIFVLCLLAAPLLWLPKRELVNLKHSTYFRFLCRSLALEAVVPTGRPGRARDEFHPVKRMIALMYWEIFTHSDTFSSWELRVLLKAKNEMWNYFKNMPLQLEHRMLFLPGQGVRLDVKVSPLLMWKY